MKTQWKASIWKNIWKEFNKITGVAKSFTNQDWKKEKWFFYALVNLYGCENFTKYDIDTIERQYAGWMSNKLPDWGEQQYKLQELIEKKASTKL